MSRARHSSIIKRKIVKIVKQKPPCFSVRIIFQISQVYKIVDILPAVRWKKQISHLTVSVLIITQNTD